MHYWRLADWCLSSPLCIIAMLLLLPPIDCTQVNLVSTIDIWLGFIPLFSNRFFYQISSIQGSVFFALPDGNGLLYNVTGTAEGPKPINNVQREVPCKTPYTELLTVTNWLRRPQRFVMFWLLKLFGVLVFFKKRLLFASQSWC